MMRYSWAPVLALAVGIAPAANGAPSALIQECITTAARDTGVAADLLYGVAAVESGFDRYAVSSAGAVGVMQIRWPLTARHLGIQRRADLFDPCINIDAGARYLVELQHRFKDTNDALAAYLLGPTRFAAQEAAGAPLPSIARNYITAVAANRKNWLRTAQSTHASGRRVVFSSRYQLRALRVQAELSRQGIEPLQLQVLDDNHVLIAHMEALSADATVLLHRLLP